MRDTESTDTILNDLAAASDPIAEAVEANEDYAMLILGVKMEQSQDEAAQGLITFINARGSYAVLAEGLYAELSDQLENGNATMFSILRDVIRDLEQEFSISEVEQAELPTTHSKLH